MPISSPIANAPYQSSVKPWKIVPKVSVSIITYNHENYIAQAIDSVLKQQVTFDYEIIIGDDCSTDGTREILQTYQQRYPDIIQLVLHPKRYDGVPGRLNNITNLYACRGQYVALLDGDDYWISDDKLQTQVEFLDQHPEYVLTFHDALVISEEKDFDSYNHSDEFAFLQSKDSFIHRDVAERWFMQTSSIMYRNKILGEFPDWFWQVYSADYILQLLISQHGKIRYFSHLSSVRRKNQNSFSVLYNQSLEDNLRRIKEIKILQQKFEYVKTSIFFRKRLARYYYRHAFLLRGQKSYLLSTLYLLKSFSTNRKYFLSKNSFLKKFI